MSDLSPKARAILDAGRDGDDPTPADRARMRQKLAGAIAATSVVGAAKGASAAAVVKGTGAAAAATSLGLGAKVVIGVVVALGALGGGFALGRAEIEAEAENHAKLAARAAALTAASAREGSGDIESAKAAPTAEAAAAPAAPADKEPDRPAPRPTAKPSASPSAAPADADTLAEETRRLGEVQGALKSGDAQKALELLDQQSAAYGRGELREERAAARVLTLCKLGRVDEAKAAAAQFLRESPRSPLADRVRAGCASQNTQ